MCGRVSTDGAKELGGGGLQSGVGGDNRTRHLYTTAQFFIKKKQKIPQ